MANETKCRECGGELPFGYRKFCSKKCRTKATNKRHREAQRLWQLNRRGKYAEGKLKCFICGKWYVQICSHTTQTHKLTGRSYREQFDLPVKRGVVPNWFRKEKGEEAIQNGTYKNLKKGKPNRFIKGDQRAKKTVFWKSRRRNPDEYYE